MVQGTKARSVAVVAPTHEKENASANLKKSEGDKAFLSKNFKEAAAAYEQAVKTSSNAQEKIELQTKQANSLYLGGRWVIGSDPWL